MKSMIEYTDAQARVIREAIIACGGTVKLARELDYATAESVRQWYAERKLVPAEKARHFQAIARQAGSDITLADIRPDLYAAITTKALGYRPRMTAPEAP
jgi:DNA-binding transcriptional regulator YdaS (Cro superfamily)